MMSPNELAATASAIAFALGNELSIEDALTLSAVLKQIGYTMETIVVQRENIEKCQTNDMD